MAELRGDRTPVKERPVAVADLRPGMVLAHAIRATSGAIVVGASQALTTDMIERLQRFVAVGGVDAVSVTLEDRGDVESPLLEIAT